VAILEQLELNQTFFIQLIIIAALFLIMGPLYFKPFLKLFQIRHARTIADRAEAEKMMIEAENKLQDYKTKIAAERAAARREVEHALELARKEESALLQQARDQAKKITQEAIDSVNQQRENLKKQLEVDVESLAHSISEKLVSRKV
jgi:F-type H+-transporting ATPase subunit b